jgi:hypothetical protein
MLKHIPVKEFLQQMGSYQNIRLSCPLTNYIDPVIIGMSVVKETSTTFLLTHCLNDQKPNS